MIEIYTENNGLTHLTRGLVKHGHYEISASVRNPELIGECCEFVRFITNYIFSGAKINHDQTISYGYWLTKALLHNDSKLYFYEYKPDGKEFIPGIDNTLFYWKTQHQVCEKAKAEFLPIRPDKKIAISEGVYEGDGVEGVRYPSPDHMSGWWLTTNKYNGDVKSLKVVHAYHVTEKRPDLAQFFALPYGYRFFSFNNNVWYDENVIKS